MSDDTVTFALEGEMTLDYFVEGMATFKDLIAALTMEAEPLGNVTWTLAGLEFGSSVATARGAAPRPESVSNVIRLFGEVGRRLERGEPLTWGIEVQKAARRIQKLPDAAGRVIRLLTAEDESEIRYGQKPVPDPARRMAYGQVTGRVQTLSETRGLRFVLYDTLHGRPVNCYLREGDREVMRDTWGRQATVSGLVTRDHVTGVPVKVTDVASVQLTRETDMGSWRAAHGVLRRMVGEERPEERIRALRDAD